MFLWQDQPGAKYRFDYARIARELNDAIAGNDMPTVHGHLQLWGKDDLFFLIYFILGIREINHPWLVERVYEVDDCCNRTLDLWAREHYKSTIITYAKSIQEVIRSPETSIGIFSHTKDIARDHLRRIKHTLENNKLLVATYPDIFWDDPQNQAPKWSERDGLIVKRKGNYLEATFEAHGVTDGMPTGKHFSILNYDDLVVRDSVSTPEQIKKTKDCFALSTNLGQRNGKIRAIGTRYHFNDLYQDMIDSGTWIVRIRVAEDEHGNTFFMTRKELDDRYADNGPYNYSAQYLQNPVADELQEFKGEWVQYYQKLPSPLNKYLLVDPANSKKRDSDYTVMVVIGIDRLGNYYLIDMIRARLALHERWSSLCQMIRKHPDVIRVGYEEYGIQADIQYMRQMQQEDGVYFNITPLKGRLAKVDRIRKLIPLFSNQKFFLPLNPIIDGNTNLIHVFLTQEYSLFPFSRHDDMLDAIARIRDDAMNVQRPIDAPSLPDAPRRKRRARVRGASNWSI